MNAENFSDYIKSTNDLYKISYQELKSLALQYPYCTNLWVLLLKKSHQEGHKEFNRNLELAAASSPDRQFLYQQIKKLESQLAESENYLLEEDFLELKDLSELQQASRPLEDGADLYQQKEEEAQAIIPPVKPEGEPEFTSPDVEIEETNDESLELKGLEEILETNQPALEIAPITTVDESPVTPLESMPSTPETAAKFEVGYSLILTIAAGITTAKAVKIPEISTPPTPTPEPTHTPDSAPKQAVVESLPKAELVDKQPNQSRMPKPMPKSSFSSWLEQFQSPQVKLQLDDLMEASRKDLKKKKKKKKKKDNQWPDTKRARQMARESIQEKDDIASVTLATLLEKQGYYEKAIQMYERLSLIFPEKSTFFAQKIENLKNLIQ